MSRYKQQQQKRTSTTTSYHILRGIYLLMTCNKNMRSKVIASEGIRDCVYEELKEPNAFVPLVSFPSHRIVEGNFLIELLLPFNKTPNHPKTSKLQEKLNKDDSMSVSLPLHDEVEFIQISKKLLPITIIDTTITFSFHEQVQ